MSRNHYKKRYPGDSDDYSDASHQCDGCNRGDCNNRCQACIVCPPCDRREKYESESSDKSYPDFADLCEDKPKICCEKKELCKKKYCKDESEKKDYDESYGDYDKKWKNSYGNNNYDESYGDYDGKKKGCTGCDNRCHSCNACQLCGCGECSDYSASVVIKALGGESYSCPDFDNIAYDKKKKCCELVSLCKKDCKEEKKDCGKRDWKDDKKDWKDDKKDWKDDWKDDKKDWKDDKKDWKDDKKDWKDDKKDWKDHRKDWKDDKKDWKDDKKDWKDHRKDWNDDKKDWKDDKKDWKDDSKDWKDDKKDWKDDKKDWKDDSKDWNDEKNRFYNNQSEESVKIEDKKDYGASSSASSKGKKFVVSFGPKEGHPWAEYDEDPESIWINGKNGPVLHLYRGCTYFFCVEQNIPEGRDPEHAFVLTNSPAGGPNSRIIPNGFAPVSKGCVCFKVVKCTPRYFFYQDAKHDFEGGLVIVHDSQ